MLYGYPVHMYRGSLVAAGCLHPFHKQQFYILNNSLQDKLLRDNRHNGEIYRMTGPCRQGRQRHGRNPAEASVLNGTHACRNPKQ